MTSRTCEQYDQQENEKADSQEDEVRRRKKIFQCEVGEEDAPEENGISNRLCSSTFIPPLTLPAVHVGIGNQHAGRQIAEENPGNAGLQM
jgi:hypothetical protein